MAQACYMAAGCVLPSGRFAVLGGFDIRHASREDAEAFGPMRRV
jgi:hypothetical protein